ncbi:MAG: ATP-binding protein [Ignavibacteria bacterium]|nr:ATP-binding protein [Ignavibacteria bacterium]
MLDRLTERLVRARLKTTPAVALVGSRQCGKTTLAKMLGGVYFDLEQEADQLRADLAWDRLCAGNEVVLLDEAQSWPALFPRLRGAIDADRSRNGRFLLLGSVSPALMTRVSESLAGRLALVEMTPLLLTELETKAQRDRSWMFGGYPDGGVIHPRNYPHWQTNYLTLLAQRDLPGWGLPAKPQVTTRLLRMLAALHGQVWNASRVGSSLGLNYKTVNTYLDFFIGAYLLRVLQPYHANIRKRLVKSPKLYWRDSGLLHALMNVPDGDALLSQPWVGASWEGWCIEQVLGTLAAKGVPVQAYYFRTSDQYEIDLVLEFGNALWAVEFKLTSSPSPADMDRLHATASLIGASRCVLVSRASAVLESGNRLSCDLAGLLARLPER